MSIRICSLAFVVSLIMLAPGLMAQTVWTVDDDGKADFSTIQAAVDVASSGDEIQIMPGSYQETVSMPAKTIRFRGIGEEGEVVLDGDNAIRLFEAVDLQGETLRLENLTFANAGSEGASIEDNSAFALFVNNGDCFINGCRFVNTNVSQGGSRSVQKVE